MYFGATSKFPRFKLTESTFKRTIKVEKANAVVINDFKYQTDFEKCLLEDEIAYYIVSSYRALEVEVKDPNKKSAWKDDWFKYIKDNNLFYGSEITLHSDVSIIKTSKKVYTDITNILDGKYTCLITDDMLDKHINSRFDKLTKEDVDYICEMLDSQDESVRDMGLKMLTGFNVHETPVTVRIMLGTRSRLKYNNAWTSTGVKQVLESIHWNGFGSFPYETAFLMQYDENNPPSEYDLSLCRDVVQKACVAWLARSCDSLNKCSCMEVFNLTATCDVS